ncbi:FAD binding domain-containing protein [Cladophialophora immunda]|nr:FAD binding domain-containing protein [Cladophialophora immunda]
MTSSTTTPSVADVDVDVLVVGGGPVGLNLAYQLRRFSSAPINPDPSAEPISVHVVEMHPKPVQEHFGRAVTFWPRSMEILAQMGLADQITQQCVAVRSSAAYDTTGTEVFGRGWSFVEGLEDTRFTFASVLRQKFVEDIFRAELARLGATVAENCKFVDLAVDESVEVGGKGRVKATILDRSAGEGRDREYTVKCRYLIGCDGSRTLVRGAAGIESDGDRTEDKWVRIDGVLKSTTMPKPRSYGAIESPLYGNVLWIPLDHGATRIGFALNDERRKLYKELNQEVFIQEAKLSVKPFDIDYERVDWASVYSVGQRVARNFWAKESVFIAGDAAHSHSSGAGQGMNAGMHDAVNLGWKLALVLTGVLKREVLETYELERQPNARKLIKYDEDISVLVSGRLPKDWPGDKTEDPNVVLGRILQEAKGFNTGLTIGFDPNLAISRDDSGEDAELVAKRTIIPAPAIAGYRAPDVQVLTPALWEPVWLHTLMANLARFYVVVFMGRSTAAKSSFAKMKEDVQKNQHLRLDRVPGTAAAAAATNGVHLNGSSTSQPRRWPVEFLTILPEKVGNAWFELGTDPLGRVYYDGDGGVAYQRYGVEVDSGAVFVVRPDGWIGARFGLGSDSIVDGIDAYLGGLLYR